jgi:ABC-type Fe3+-hydroxamate transport system substrate-binding protein
MMVVTDQMGRTVVLEKTPKRIVSLVPSQTELLFDLGLSEEVVGITKFCVHPDSWYRTKKRVGGTKQLNLEVIAELQPDLIIGNKEENDRESIERLSTDYPVWMSDIANLDDALRMIVTLGHLTAREARATAIVKQITDAFNQLQEFVRTNELRSKKAAYFIWKDPEYCAGLQTFIDAMLDRCGLVNAVNKPRYPEWDNAYCDAPDLVLLSSEPFPFQQKHVEAFEERFPKAKVRLVDGEYFSWYGSRLINAPVYFQSLLKELASN